MQSLEASLKTVRREIQAACERAGRSPTDVLLIGATKFVPVETISMARHAGIADFGENYAGELAEKANAVDATWHFIGTLQAGNASRIGDHAHVVHSAVPGTAFDRIARRATRIGKTIRCLVQVDFTGDRNGLEADGVAAFLETAVATPGVEMIGLMTMPPWLGDAEEARPYFHRLRELRDDLQSDWPGLRELSMGMSGDFQVAVEEGATMLRIGTALFGERPAKRAPERAERFSRGAKET
ncbi:MAG TPA: YggS family pyridoxal phosphate-dependent enzyme [Actinomycetota bacterium]|jgi:hypothetical protein